MADAKLLEVARSAGPDVQEIMVGVLCPMAGPEVGFSNSVSSVANQIMQLLFTCKCSLPAQVLLLGWAKIRLLHGILGSSDKGAYGCVADDIHYCCMMFFDGSANISHPKRHHPTNPFQLHFATALQVVWMRAALYLLAHELA